MYSRDKLNKFLDFSVIVLFITNLWIILFTNILTYLSFIRPPVASSQLLRAISFPNPFKIPLYIFLTFVFILLIRLRPVATNNISILIKSLIFIILAIIFLNSLGGYPMAGEIHPYTLRADKTIYDIVILLYLTIIAIFIIQTAIISRLLIRQLADRLSILITILVIAFLTFEAGFPFSGTDWASFFGPILEIASGKTIFTDIPVQHGFLSILSFTLLYKLGFLKLSFLSAFVWVLYIIQYFLSFYLIKRIGKSVSLALIGLFSIITVNYFSLSELPISLPQIGAMRWLPAVLILILFYKVKKIDSKILIFITALLSLWIVDAGIALILAYLLTLFIFVLAKQIDLKNAVKSGLWLLGSLGFILFVINIFHLLLGFKSVNFLNLFHTIRNYASLGIAQLPIPNHTYFWLVILIYFTSIIYFFRTNSVNILRVSSPEGVPSAEGISESRALGRGRDRPRNIVLILSANLMLFASIYYVGRAHPHNLFNISLLPLLTFFLLIAKPFRELKSQKLKIIIVSLIFLFFIAFPAFNRRQSMTEMILLKYERLMGDNIFTPEIDEIIERRYTNEKKLIQNNLKDDKIAILSNDDTYLFLLTGKKNLLDANPQVDVDTYDDLGQAIKNFAKICPPKIATDCSIFNRCSQSIGINKSGFFPASIILDEIQKKCKIKYEPLICTNQLCIAGKNK